MDCFIRMIEEFAYKHPEKGKAFASIQKHADVVVGNSSSGLIEAPSFELPVVNIGDRQRGRIRGRNVIDVFNCEKEAIEKAIKQALPGMKNPYGEGAASDKIVEKLKAVQLDEVLIKKRFYEMLQYR